MRGRLQARQRCYRGRSCCGDGRRGHTGWAAGGRYGQGPRFGIFDRVAYNEVPPCVEYVVAPFDMKFIRILDEPEKLQLEITGEI